MEQGKKTGQGIKDTERKWTEGKGGEKRKQRQDFVQVYALR